MLFCPQGSLVEEPAGAREMRKCDRRLHQSMNYASSQLDGSINLELSEVVIAIVNVLRAVDSLGMPTG